MVAINIIQAILTNRLNSLALIVGFPGTVLAVVLVITATDTAFSRQGLRLAWDNAEVPQRVTWRGTVLSIVLPVVVCDFVYMPFVAVEAWHEVKRDTSLEIPTSLRGPAVVADLEAKWMPPGIIWNMSSPSCSVANSIVSPVNTGWTFNGLTADVPIPHVVFEFGQSPAGSTDVGTIEIDITWNSGSFGSQTWDYLTWPYVSFAVFDESIAYNFDNDEAGCTVSPDPFQRPTQSTYVGNLIRQWQLTVDTFYLNDRVGTLQAAYRALVGSDAKYCSLEAMTRNSFLYYLPASFQAIPPALVPQNTSCDTSNSTGGFAPCSMTLYLSLSSPLVTTQTSSRGTNTLQILIDEGSILGVIFSMTWFSDIFII